MRTNEPQPNTWPQARSLDEVKNLLKHLSMPRACAVRLPTVWKLLADRPQGWHVSTGVPVPARTIASLYRRRLDSVAHLETTALGLREVLQELERVEGDVVLVHCCRQDTTLLLALDGAHSMAGWILFREPRHD